MELHFLARMRQKPALSVLARVGAACARRYIDGYNNARNRDMRRNGEVWLIERVSAARDELVFIDVGANRGNWTCAALTAAPDCRIYAFEMIPNYRKRLHDRFDCDSRVTLMECGLSSAEATTTAYASGIEQGGGQLVWRPESNKQPIPTEVKLMRGDDALAGVEGISLIKIDTDGHEMQVLEGLSETIARSRPLIQFEYSQFTMLQRAYLRDFYDLFETVGYSCGRLLPGSVEFGAYYSPDEDFQTANFVACPSDQLEIVFG